MAQSENAVPRPRSSYCQDLGTFIQQKWKKRKGFDDSVRFDIAVDAQGKIQHVQAVDTVSAPPAVQLAGKRFFTRLKNLPVLPSAIKEPLWLRVALSNNGTGAFVRCFEQ